MDRSGLALNFLGTPAFAGISSEVLIAKRFNLKFGVGIASFGLGLTHYIKVAEQRRLILFFGVKSKVDLVLFESFQMIHDVPMGASLFGDFGFLSFDIEPAIYDFEEAHIFDFRKSRNIEGKQFGIHLFLHESLYAI